MKRFHHIVVAIDFTPPCRRALREAVRRASVDEAKITAVHVMDAFLVHELRNALSTTDAAILADWNAHLRKFVNESDAGAELVQTEVRIGHPFCELVDACKQRNADLLVMGARGSKINPDRVGAIVAKCIRHAPVDVMVVQQESMTPFHRVVACVDFSANSAKAVEAALHIALQDRAAVECLHVRRPQPAMAISGFDLPIAGALPSPSDAQCAETCQKELDAFVQPMLSQSSLAARTRLLDGLSVRQSILTEVRKSDADLIVLGTTGKSSLRHLLIGTTAEKIVQWAPCSLLVVKPDDGAVQTV